MLLMKHPCCLELGSTAICNFCTVNGLWNGIGVLYICDTNNCLSHKKKVHTCTLCMHTFTNLPGTIHFLSLLYGMLHKDCVRLPSVFYAMKDDKKKIWNLKDRRVCVCVCVCARAWHTHTHTQYEFHKNPLCWVSSPLGCDDVSLGEQFLTIQGISLPLKDKQPLVQNTASHPSQFESPAALLTEPQLSHCTSYCGIPPIPVSSIAMKPNNRLQYHHAVNRAHILYHHVLSYCPQPVKHKVIHNAPVYFISHDSAADIRNVSLKFYMQVLLQCLVSDKFLPALDWCKRYFLSS